MILKVAAMAAAIIATVIVSFLLVTMPKPVLDCGFDKVCFTTAAKSCVPAIVRTEVMSDFGEYVIRILSNTMITGVIPETDCMYRVKVEDVNILARTNYTVPQDVMDLADSLNGSEMDCPRSSNISENRIPGPNARGDCDGSVATLMDNAAGIISGAMGDEDDAAPEAAYSEVVKSLQEGEIIGYVFPESLEMPPGESGTFEIGLRNIDYVGRCFLIDMLISDASPDSVYTSYGCGAVENCEGLKDDVSGWFSYGTVVWIDGQGIEFYSGYVLPYANASAGTYLMQVASSYSNASDPYECDAMNDFSESYHTNSFNVVIL